MVQQNIGAYIARKRKEMNLTQAQFAELVNVSNKTVSKWETGKCMPDYSVIEDVCDVLNISIAELMDGEDMVENSIRAYDEGHIKTLLDKIVSLEGLKNISVEIQLFIVALLFDIKGDMLMDKGGMYEYYGICHYVMYWLVMLSVVYIMYKRKKMEK